MYLAMRPTQCLFLFCVVAAAVPTAFFGPYVGGALIAACFCWAGVTLYFFRRYRLSVWIALAAVVILLVYKIAVIGW
jgi:fucose 4-O-acetylase-like acetyltransferase